MLQDKVEKLIKERDTAEDKIRIQSQEKDDHLYKTQNLLRENVNFEGD